MGDPHTEQFFAALEGALSGGRFVKLTLAKYRGPETDLRNLYVRPVRMKGDELLSFLYRYRTRDVVKNYAAEGGVRLLRSLLGAQFLGGHLFTLSEDLQIDFNRRRESRLVARPPSFKERPTPEHDRRKRRALSAEGSVYLRELGVTNERGEVLKGAGDKFRQINKFVEVLGSLYAASPLAGEQELSVVDVGSGKGYLTFAAYDYFNNVLGVGARVEGVEARAELVELCNRVARLAGFDRLGFREGFIQDFEMPPTDILIALHACDTATDDALFKGIGAGASVIITAPCCHKEVRPQISPPEPLRAVLRHGILLEREAETLTDSMRALLLEHAGYKVKVFEFVSTEHTRKNTMIAAVRREGAAGGEEALRQFRALKEFYGVGEQRLETLLCGPS
ncbi:MAG TPA: SAM-dependent methyltransferase [Pyrinomonadaceae bacterium]|nr:SAM-dependent methyltransferase [Pyrinomonadaceae bacterium]